MLWRPKMSTRVLMMAALAASVSASVAAAQTSPEIVIVTTARHGPSRSTIGAPIEDVSLSAPVRTEDLNLQTPDGFLKLADRVRQTAQRLCARLRFQHPIGTPVEYRCVQTAVDDATYEIDAALRRPVAAPEIQTP